MPARILPKVTYQPTNDPPPASPPNRNTIPGYTQLPVRGDALGGWFNQVGGGINNLVGQAAGGVNDFFGGLNQSPYTDPTSPFYKPNDVSDYHNPPVLPSPYAAPQGQPQGQGGNWFDGIGNALGQAQQGIYGALNNWGNQATQAQQGIYNGLNAAGNALTGVMPQGGNAPQGGGGNPLGYGSPTAPQGGGGNPLGYGGAGGEGQGAPAGTSPTTPPTGGANNVPQSALDNNQRNQAAAAAAGDTQAMARLQAEWQRIAPLAQSRGITADRLVNSYMDPKNPAAKSDLNSALAAAIADDVWGNEATNAFGRPPTQNEWDEHWRAMNVGGRDPLEGHPQAVQNIQAQMQGMGQQNQTGQFDAYSQWLAGQK